MKNKPIREGYLFTKNYSNYVFILLFLLYLFDYADRMVVTSMFSTITEDWGTSEAQNAWLVSVIYLTIGILTFPISILIDRWSRSKVIGIMAIFWSLATIVCAFTGTYIQLFMARILIGFGEAGYAPGGTALISGMYPQEKRSKMMGLWNASIPIGSAIGVTMGGIFAGAGHWKHAFGIVSIPGLIIAILFLFVKDYKTVDLSYVDKQQKKIKMEKKDMLREFLSKPSVLLTYFGMTAIVFVTTAMISWLPTFFENTHNMSRQASGSMAGSIMVLALVGAPIGGYLVDRWKKNQKNARMLFPAISTFISSVLLFIAFILLKGKMQIVVLYIFGVWVMTFIAGAAAVTQDVIHPGLRATSYAIAVTVQNILGSFTAPLVLAFLYKHYDIKVAMSVLPFVLVIGALLFFIGSRYYVSDMEKVAKIKLEAAE
jgi:MFS family permease